MALAFTGLTTYLSNSAPAVSTWPCTFSCAVRNFALTTQQSLFGIGTTGGGNANSILLQTTGAGQIQFQVQDGAGSNQATATLAVLDNKWHLATGVMTSPTNYRVYLDGGSVGTQTASRSPTGFNLTYSSRWFFSGGAMVSNGELGHLAIWSMALSATDVAALMTTLPSSVQAGNLVGYWPLNTNSSTQPDLGSGNHALTMNGTLAYVNDDFYAGLAAPFIIPRRRKIYHTKYYPR